CVVVFFQAEDGIRYWSVTGVQTCALPISAMPGAGQPYSLALTPASATSCRQRNAGVRLLDCFTRQQPVRRIVCLGYETIIARPEIGRASCRGGAYVTGGGGTLRKAQRR